MKIVQSKEQYVSPKCEVLEAWLEGVMSVSPGDYPEWKEEDIING